MVHSVGKLTQGITNSGHVDVPCHKWPTNGGMRGSNCGGTGCTRKLRTPPPPMGVGQELCL